MLQSRFVVAFLNILSLHLDVKPSFIYLRPLTDSSRPANHLQQMLALSFKQRLRDFFFFAFALAFAAGSSITSRRRECVFGALVLSRRPRSIH